MRKLISLGHRCDVAFQLRMHSGDNEAQFFDWLASPVAGVIRALERDFDVFHPDHLVRRDQPHDHLIDRMSGIIFWHQFPMREAKLVGDPMNFYAGFAAKFAHLAQRFRTVVTTRPVTLVRQQVSEAEALRLEAAFFRRFPGADARFLYLVAAATAFTTPHGHAVVFPASSGSLGDPEQWAAVLGAESLITAPYRLSTADILGHDPDDHNLMAENRFSDAQLRRAIAANPGQIGYRLERARQQIRSRAFADARDELSAAAEIAPADAELAVEYLVLRWRLGEIATEAAGQQAMRLAPPRQTAQMHDYLDLLLRAKRGARLRNACNAFLRQRPFDARIYAMKAQGCLLANMTREADCAIERALTLDPGNPQFAAVLATVAMHRQKGQGALPPGPPLGSGDPRPHSLES